MNDLEENYNSNFEKISVTIPEIEQKLKDLKGKMDSSKGQLKELSTELKMQDEKLLELSNKLSSLNSTSFDIIEWHKNQKPWKAPTSRSPKNNSSNIPENFLEEI